MGNSLQDRAERAAKIIAKASEYKICEGCESIVTQRVTTCPNCHGYRFDVEPESVITQARLLGSREQQGVVAEDLL